MLDAIAQTYNSADLYDYNTQATVPPELLFPIIIISLLLAIVTIVGLWKIFEKAGQKGWKAIIPIYNLVIFFRIIGRSPWLILIYLLAPIPVIGFVATMILTIITMHDLSRSFGKGVGMTILNIFFPFIGYPILGFGDAVYRGPAAATEGKANNTTPPPSAPTNTTTPPSNTPPTV